MTSAHVGTDETLGTIRGGADCPAVTCAHVGTDEPWGTTRGGGGAARSGVVGRDACRVPSPFLKRVSLVTPLT